MDAQMTLLIQQLFRFILMIVIGFVIVRLKWLSSDDFNAYSRLVIRLLLPCFYLTVIPAAGNREDLLTALPLFGLGLFSLTLMLVVGTLTAVWLKMPDGKARAHIVSNAMTNTGFMGIPLGGAMFGAPGVLAASMVGLASDILLWTIGRSILARHLNIGLEQPAENAANAQPRFSWKMLININIIAIIAACTLLALEINPVGNLAWDVLGGIGAICGYLPMIIIGGILGTFEFRQIGRYKSVLMIVLSKMILLPAAAAVLVALLFPGMSDINFQMLIIAIAIPTFATSAATASAFGADAQYAASCTTITTVASMVTLPLVFMYIQLF